MQQNGPDRRWHRGPHTSTVEFSAVRHNYARARAAAPGYGNLGYAMP
jgi:hypothetical protein